MSLRVGLVASIVLVCACSEGPSQSPVPQSPDASVNDVHATPDLQTSPVDAPVPRALPSVLGLPELEDHNPAPDIVEVDLRAAGAEAELVAGRMTRVQAYNGRTPGPLLHARVGDRVIVHFTNDLAEPTTIHWHGLRIPSEMDGNPEVVAPVEPGASFTYDFVVRDPGTFWYHPHVNTIRQIERGLYGAIVVHEASPPSFTAERLFVLDDIRLGADGQIAPFVVSGHDLIHGRAGNVLLVNGSSSRLTASAARGSVERWRVVNAAGSRTMTLSVEGASWRVIGTDGGLLPAAYTTPRLTVAAGQRFDLEVSFDAETEGSARLVSHVLAASADGGVALSPRTVAELNYEGVTVTEAPRYPEVRLAGPAEQPRLETIRLGANTQMGVQFTINGFAHHPPTLHVVQNQPVRFTVINEIGPEHPFHLHGQFFQILSRGGSRANEPGLKDTVLLGAMERVVIETSFENPGRWMYHCHIPEHSEFGMMAEVEVSPAP